MKRSGFKGHSGFKSKTGFSNRNGILNDNKKKRRNELKSRNRKNRRQNAYWNEIIKCDRVFSRVIRIIGSDSRGQCKCFTCSFVGNWKHGGIECGHFKSRSNIRTRWHLDNARPQCTKCNQVLNGNIKIFRKRLIETRSETIVEKVERRSKEVTNLSETDVKEIRLKFERMERELRKKKGI